MKITKYIEQKLNSLFEEFKNDDKMDAGDLLEILRKESGEFPYFFDMLLEKLLAQAFEKGYIITSPGVYKFYLQSAYMSDPDKLNPSDIHTIYTGSEYVKVGNEKVEVLAGLFLKIINKIKLNKTKQAYIEYLLKKISHDEFIRIMYSEFKQFKKKIIKISDLPQKKQKSFQTKIPQPFL